MYYRNASAAVLVVDVTSEISLQVAERWVLDVRQQADRADCYLIMAANKVDIPNRTITTEQIQTFCTEKGIDFLETSARNGLNVNELFEKVCDHCLPSETPSVDPGIITCIEAAPKWDKKKVGSAIWRQIV